MGEALLTVKSLNAWCCPCCWNGFIPSGAGRLKVTCRTIRRKAACRKEETMLQYI